MSSKPLSHFCLRPYKMTLPSVFAPQWKLHWICSNIPYTILCRTCPVMWKKFTSNFMKVMLILSEVRCLRTERKIVVREYLIIFINSGTPPYGHLVIMVTSLLRPLFCLPAKMSLHFLVNKPSLIRSPLIITAIFFWPFGDGNNGVSLTKALQSTADDKYVTLSSQKKQCWFPAESFLLLTEQCWAGSGEERGHCAGLSLTLHIAVFMWSVAGDLYS